MINTFIEKAKGRKVLLEHEAKGVLAGIGFPVPKGRFFGKGEETPVDPGLAYPLVAKVSSSAISSKTNVGGIRVGIRDAGALRAAVEELLRIDHAEGVLVEEMAPPGLEVIIGGIIDNQFGPVVMFGLGGIFVELFRDVAFGLAPLTIDDSLWLLAQVKGYRLLEGYRGNPPVDKERLAALIASVSEIMATGRVQEIDLNPVALYPEGAMVLDAKIQMIF